MAKYLRVHVSAVYDSDEPEEWFLVDSEDPSKGVLSDEEIDEILHDQSAEYLTDSDGVVWEHSFEWVEKDG